MAGVRRQLGIHPRPVRRPGAPRPRAGPRARRRRGVRGIDKGLVCGGSGGATLALSYAQAHPDRVTELVLRGIFLFDQYEVDWLYKEGGASAVYPEQWDEFISLIPQSEHGDL